MPPGSKGRRTKEIAPFGDARFEASLQALQVRIWALAKVFAARRGLTRDQAAELAADVTLDLANELRASHARVDDGRFVQMCRSADLTAWVYCPVRDRYVDMRRRQDAEERSTDSLRLLLGIDGNTFASPLTFAEEGEIRRRYEEALRDMTPVQRRAFTLRFEKGAQWEVIARLTRLPMTTAVHRFNEARALLRDRFQDYRGWRRESDVAVYEEFAP